MKSLIFILSLAFCTIGFSQNENNEGYYQTKIEQLGIELQLLEDMQKDYELTIDSLYNSISKDSINTMTYKFMVDYYTLRSENLRTEMKQMVLLISSLVEARKEDE